MAGIGTQPGKLAVGAIGELCFAAACYARGLQCFWPIGAQGLAVDLLVLTPTHAIKSVQVRTNSTRKLRTASIPGRLDCLAIWGCETWHLVPWAALDGRRTCPIKTMKKYRDDWRILA